MTKVQALIETDRFTVTDNSPCFVSKRSGTVIDFVNPSTEKTLYYSKNLETCRETYLDAEMMTLGEWCEWKAAQQRTPIAWEEVTEERFYDMLECLPPAAGTKGWREFLVGEPYDHDALSGEPRYQGFRRTSSGYFASSRPMTVTEFRAEVGDTL